MKLFLLSFFTCFSVLVFAQKAPLKVFKGMLVCDSLQVERATITNITEGIKSISDDLGFFTIQAKVGDTLVVSSVNFDTEKIILQAADFKEIMAVIHLTLNVNTLDEVKVGAFKLTGDLVYDAQRIKVKPAPRVDLSSIDFKNIEITGVKSTPNLAMTDPIQPIPVSINFVKLGKKLFRLLEKNREFEGPKPIKIYDSQEFVVELRKRFDTDFFLHKLGVEEDKINLFLVYCFSDQINQKRLLEKSNALNLIDFLTEKSVAFHKE